MIPNVISQAQLDPNFQKLKGAQVIRIATNHQYQKMGYGSRTLQRRRQVSRRTVRIFLSIISIIHGFLNASMAHFL